MNVLLPKKSKKGQALMVKITASRKRSNIKIQTRRCKWDPEAMDLAIQSLNNGEINVSDVLKIFNIPRQPLDNRVHGKYEKEGAAPNPDLTSHLKRSKFWSVIVFIWPNWTTYFQLAILKSLHKQHQKLNPTSSPSWKWWNGFRKRHLEITLRKPDGLDRVQSRMNNQTVMDNFFVLYKTLLDEIGLTDKPAHYFQCGQIRERFKFKSRKSSCSINFKACKFRTKIFQRSYCNNGILLSSRFDFVIYDQIQKILAVWSICKKWPWWLPLQQIIYLFIWY